MKRRLMLLFTCMSSFVMAELPPDVDEVLFDLTHGIDYAQWAASTGVVKFVRRFGPFDGGVFRSYADTTNSVWLKYEIVMERRFDDSTTYTQATDSLKDAEKALSIRLGSPCFSTVETEAFYGSTCKNIDGRGWEAFFCVRAATNGFPLKASVRLYNPLHEKGKWISCHDLERVSP